MTMLPHPTRFFVTSGKALSPVSELNAFDKALIDAGIGEQNLVLVSSILPVGIKQVEKKKLPQGAITFAVIAKQSGNEGEMISAGIAYAFRKDGHGGYVAEGHLHGPQKNLKEYLQWKMIEMAKLRNVELQEIRFKTEELSIPMDNYGVCLAALVFLD
jgi:arginine decarboxylase